MSRNGYEMDDEKSDARTSEPGTSSHESSPDVVGSSRARKSRAPKANAKSASGGGKKKKGGRKSTPPRNAANDKAPKAVVVDLAATLVIPPKQNPAARIAPAVSLSHHAKLHPDLISIPPADLDEHDERFFAEGEAASQRGEHVELAAPTRKGRRSHAEVFERPRIPVVPPERRKKLANYVKMAVVVSSVLCVAAIVRVAIGSGENGVPERSAAAAQIAPPVAAIAQAEVAVPAKDPVAVERAPAASAPVASAPEVPLKSAHEEREDARHALELGKIKDAIEAATRSITVDPTDAEAWLLLGAAQQDSGHGAEAHAAFVECTKQAKTGNVGECRAMLRWNGPPR